MRSYQSHVAGLVIYGMSSFAALVSSFAFLALQAECHPHQTGLMLSCDLRLPVVHHRESFVFTHSATSPMNSRLSEEEKPLARQVS